MNLPRANYPAKPTTFGYSTGQLALGVIPPDAPPLTIGDRCQLLGGSPTLLVVDIEPTFTVAWHNGCGVSEHVIERAAVRRVA